MSGMTRRGAIAGLVAGSAMAPIIAKAQSRTGAPSAAAEAAAAATPFRPVTPALTEYIAGAQTAAVPEPVRERARMHILDTLASIVACRDLEAGRLGRAYALGAGGKGSSTILGTTGRAGIVDAVFAGAMAGHAAEINDFIPSAYVQPGPSIVSAAFALAEARNLSGRQVTNAVIAGYELAGRMPKAIGTPALFRAGIANHGIGPVFGTAAASSSLMGLKPEAIAHVLSYSAQQASGSWQWLLDVRHVEKAFVFAGMGARNGLQSALMVETGFTGVADSLDAEGGWLRSPAFEKADRAYLVDGLGTQFELDHAAFKRYPTGGPTQPAVQALLELRKQVKPEEVTRILIEMPGRADAFAGAKMPALNLPYIAALIMIDGRLDFTAVQSLERMHNDPKIDAFRKLVQVIEDKAQEAPDGEARVESARVTIERNRKPSLVKFVPYVTGFPSHPMGLDELEAKTGELLEPLLGRTRSRDIIARLRGFEDESDVHKLIALIAR
ncbi:MmgE/PrpD family protein [Sphingopyxis sp. JAI128]|uniref:MmgE/PrpD family protein n=1 Tax=Sphingopyxis sp. JAI128 TaxID=2723066 RepID=UPI00160744AF|nr:MmgE/PrpD family protein [Sphingopyxis sp. JAI128]MBB6426710.1 2-methylcitrate dehydratase PrpD [Sphingopyxis sp. JAI128]